MSEKMSHSSIAGQDTSTDIDLREVFLLIADNKWKIALITGVMMAFSLVCALFMTPIYSAGALIQVEQSSAGSMLSQFSDILPDGKPRSQTEIGLLRSRMVLGQTVDELGLDTVIQEKHFPLMGKGLARLSGHREGVIGLLELTVPERLLDVPFTLTVLSPARYSITLSGVTSEGSTGEILTQEGVRLQVGEISAPSGTVFSITKLDRLTAINHLLANFTVSDLNKDSGMLQLTFKAESPRQATQILASISKHYLQQNVVRKSEEAARSLDFLKEQLPLVRARLDESENRLNQFRQKNESVDLSLEAKAVLDNTVALETQINEVTFKEAEISKLYTRDHPAYRALMEKRSLLLKERDRLNTRIAGMPKVQQEILSLTRDVQSGQEIYMLLLNKQQELSISKASTVGSVRIIDAALAEKKPVSPRKSLLIILGLVSGLVMSFGWCVLLKILREGLESSEQIESTGLTVYAAIPVSKWLKGRCIKEKKKTQKHVRSVHLLARDNPGDLAVEAIRSLRTSLHFAMMQSGNRIVVISGATPEVGKTFVSCNLAVVIAQSAKKVLLIDSDLRKGQAHHVMGSHEKEGLSDYLAGSLSIDEVIQHTDIIHLDFISRGQLLSNPQELLMGERYGTLMDWAAKTYDFVLIDTPPVLAVSDVHIVARYAGTIMLVARFRKSTVKDVEISAKRFAHNNLTLGGIIFNGVEKGAANYYEYGTYSYSQEN